MLEEMKDRQAKMASIQSSMQSGDIKSGCVDLRSRPSTKAIKRVALQHIGSSGWGRRTQDIWGKSTAWFFRHIAK